MRKRKLYSLICIAVATALLFVSCTGGNQEELATVQFAIRETATRTISPEHGTLVATQYRFKFENGPKDITRTLNVNDEGTYRIVGVTPGSYRVTVEALNSRGTVLATTMKSYRFLPGLSNYSMTLSALKGSGELKVTFTWDKNLFVDNEGAAIEPTIQFVLEDQLGNAIEVEEDEFTTDSANGTVVLDKTDLPAGSYLLAFTLKNGSEIVTGAVDVARVTDGVKTEGSIHLNLNRTIDVSGFAVVDQTSAPIQATITATPISERGTTVSFSVDFDYLPNGITEDDVTVTWYNNEFEIPYEGSTVEFAPYDGTSRITAVYLCPKLGSMGSTSIEYEASTV